jgi:uncharacterized protein YbaP (TraB family)
MGGLNAQMKVDLPEDNGLLWEITGKGLTKPSYVYGTMHVSSKLAFHLGDSFYYALQSVDMVALEQNLDTVIDDWVQANNRNQGKSKKYFPSIGLYTFDMSKIRKDDINTAISYDPYVLNSIMFRTNEEAEDFQYETYLDLYIYRLGKKMGKIIGGVEDYKEAKDLVKKAQKGARKDYKEKRKNGDNDDRFRFQNFDFSDAYRKGNIKLIDSFERTTNGKNFMEYMLFVRNENMVRRMDSIMQLGTSLFTGVGCAHLGAERGVLNLLVNEGYSIRPVQSMANRISPISKKYDDVKYPLTYNKQMSPDSSFEASIPGEWITALDASSVQIYIHPELVNGYFYTVYKLKTYGTIFGEEPKDILLRVDSSLFESVPGKIMEQKDITIGGHPGYEIINKTTEGDFQRYYIVVRPLDVYIFKLGGKEGYAKSKDAEQFFNSIKFTTQKSNNFKTFKTIDGTLSFQFPSHAATKSVIHYEEKHKANFKISAYDDASKTTYIAQQLRCNRNYEEDTFDLKMLMESFINTDNFELVNYKIDQYKGYDRLIASCLGTKNRKAKCEILMIDDKMVLLAAISTSEQEPNINFFNSISINTPKYDQSKFIEYYDAEAKYKVMTPAPPMEDSEEDDDSDDSRFGGYFYYQMDEDEGDSTEGMNVSKTFASLNGEEVIKVSFFTKDRYSTYDSLSVLELNYLRKKDAFFFVVDTSVTQEGNKTIVSAVLGDTATPMQTFTKNIYTKGGFYEVYGAFNKNDGPSEFVTTFLETFEPIDTLWDASPFSGGFDSFYADFFNKDSANRERLIKKVTGWRSSVRITDESAPKFISFIENFYIDEKYVSRKAKLVEKLGKLEHKEIFPALQRFYVNFGDTTNLKMAVLLAMARQKTDKAYAFVLDKLINDLPIGAKDLDDLIDYRLYDTLELTVKMFPDLLDLTIVDEIDDEPYYLLGRLLDSNLIKPKVYKKYLKTIYLDAFYSLKRKMVKEETKDDDELGIITATNKDKWNSRRYMSYGSNYLKLARLLVPFKDKKSEYKQLFSDMHKLRDVGERFKVLKFCIKHDLDYPDSMLSYYANRKKYRLKLYSYLQEANRLDLFPSKYLSNDSIIYARLQTKYNGYYSKVDSLVLNREYTYFQDGTTKYGRIYLLYKTGEERPDIVRVSNIPKDSVGEVYGYVIRNLGTLGEEEDVNTLVSNYVRQYQLRQSKPNQYYWRALYRSFDYPFNRF